MIYPIIPVPKPRMTRRDKWKKRPCVLRYHAFKDEMRLHGVHIPESGSHVIFHIPVPKSLSAKKRAERIGKAHQQRPDVDNLIKACLDALYEEDSGVFDIRVSKFWSETGGIEIRILD